MSRNQSNPNQDPRHELSEPLRQAVDQVRAAPVPPESMERALDRARKLGTRLPIRRNQRRRAIFALAALAAAILLAVFLGPWGYWQEKHDAVASFEVSDAPGKFVSTAPETLTAFGRKNTASPDAMGKEEEYSIPPAPGAGAHPVPTAGADPRRPVDRPRLDRAGDDGKERNLANGQPGTGGGLYGPSSNARDRNKDDLSKDAKKLMEEVEGQRMEVRRLEIRGATRAELKAAADKLQDLEKQVKDGDKKEPAVWQRNAKSPTLARVYIGDGNALELVSLQVTVTVEGPRARTVVDHIFHNPHGKQLEGTFEYPMPTGASPSYFAMFLGQTRDTVPQRFTRRGDNPPLPADKLALLSPDQLVKEISTADWGTFQEGRIVGKEKALETYEDIVRGRIDPALMEYAAGNTFRGRVFPIPSKGFNRVILAYEELLPCSQDQVIYRYPLPDGKLGEIQFTLNATAAECKKPSFKPEDANKSDGGSQLAYTKTWKDKGPGGDVLFTYTPADPRIQTLAGRQGDNGPFHLYARVRPELKVEAGKAFAKHAVFLLDTSLSEHPDRFNVNMKLMKKILEGDTNIQKFNVLPFNIGAAWVEPKGFLPNSEAGREKLLSRLDGIVLEGATDIGAALDKLCKPGFDIAPGTPLEVFVLSDGQITWGEPDVSVLTSRLENRCPYPTRFHCYRTGLGADNLELFEALTRKGGGIFNCFTEADLAAAAQAHRHQCLQIEKVRFVGGVAASDVMVAGRKAAVYPGGELVVAARFSQPGKTLLVVEGTLAGEKYAEEFSVEVANSGELAARGWAEVAVASLLALNDPKLDSLVTAYCQQFGVASRVASFLVLENANDYKRLNLEDERGKIVPGGDVGKFLDDAWKALGKPLSARDGFVRFLEKIEPRVKTAQGPHAARLKKLLPLLTEADFELPEGMIAGAIVTKNMVPPQYLAARDADRRNADTYLAEARRRQRARDIDGAVRVLSSVIEEHPGRGDALRLVGYRLLDLGQPAQAARLFDRVEKQRPFEPHSYLDMARSLEECGKYALAAVHYEIALQGTWHNRFGNTIREVGTEEYVRMMRQAVASKKVSADLADFFGNTIEQANPKDFQSDLRVSATWNTDQTDVDLWVIEPDGTKVFYQARNSKNGGELSQDMTQGYGPERFVAKQAMAGEYTVIVHYYSANPNLLAGETHVSVSVTTNAGSSEEKTQRHTVILKKANEQAEVCRVKVK
jgi:von Willebrand factor type A domain/Vault protein inter-alpha-trypsin domain